MDLKKIFIKNAKPTKVGGQAVLDGIMMKGEKRTALTMRMPDGSLYARIKPAASAKKWMKIPFVRGVGIFGQALVEGVKTITHSADVLEKYEGEGAVEDDKLTAWMNKKFGKEKAWNIMIYFAVALSLAFSIGVFMILPTAAVSLFAYLWDNDIFLNLVEGVVRIILFVVYVLLISRLDEIDNVFKYHGAEHKTIHCFENGKELTVENAKAFTTLHPRCGTSFLMFVLVISLTLFSFLGWPSLIIRIASRIVLLPVIAGIAYELLRWAGKSDNIVVKILSIPGILLQKITTSEPREEHLEVAIVAIKAAMREEGPMGEGLCDENGNLVYNVRLLVKNGEERLLKAGIEPYEAKNQAELLYCYLKKVEKGQLYFKGKEKVSFKTMSEYFKLIDKKKEGVPLQYITGTQDFMDLTFIVNENVLIPRFDTEVVVEKAEELIRRLADEKGIDTQIKVLDLCSGSGVIGITLDRRCADLINVIGGKAENSTPGEVNKTETAEVEKQRTSGIYVVGSDLSEAALEVAEKNKEKLGSNIQFIQGNMFENVEEKFHMIISNPPYIPRQEIESLMAEVKSFEPMMALDGGLSGLDFYRQIVSEAHEYLMPGGYVVFEIGHGQGADIVKFFEGAEGYEKAEVLLDLGQKERTVFCKYVGK